MACDSTQHDAVHFDGFPAWLWLPGLAPRRCLGRRGSPPHSTKQARNQKTGTKQRQVCSPKATDTKARPPNQFNNQTTRRPREAQRPMQSKPSPPSQPGGATGPTSISLFVLVCVVWVCSPKATDTKPSPPSQPDGATGSISLFVLVCVVWVCSPQATETKAKPPNQFNNQRTQRPRSANRPRQGKPSPPSQTDGATGPTSICLCVFVCVVWVVYCGLRVVGCVGLCGFCGFNVCGF